MNIRRWLLGLALALVAGAVIVWLLLLSPYPVMSEAEAALESDAQVTVTSQPWLTFTPASGDPGAGLVLYTGARVPPEAYAPLARAIAEDGYLVVIPELPLNLAVLAVNAASDPMAWYEDVESWAVGGHSLGGAMAARFAAASEEVEGLALLAAYPEDGLDMSQGTLAALVALATNDEIADEDRVRAGLDQLPSDAELLEVVGGNHAGFGWYGEQPGDGVATISRDEQTQLTAAAIVDLLDRIDDGS